MNSNVQQHTLIIDENIKMLFMPITDKRREQILTSCENIPSIKVWKNFLIDGYDTYTVYCENSIPFSYEELDIPSKDEAIAYAAISSIKNPEMNPERKRYCIGKLHEALKKMGVDNPHLCKIKPSKEEKKVSHYSLTNWRTAKLAGYSTRSLSLIYRATCYSSAIDNIYKLCPLLAYEILNGVFYISSNNLSLLSVLSKNSLNVVYNTFDRCISSKQMREKLNNLAITEKLPKKFQRITLNSASIKQMPKYDPDADFSSITFTINAWIYQLERLYNNASFSTASAKALYNVEQQLTNLCATSKKILFKIKGDYYE